MTAPPTVALLGTSADPPSHGHRSLLAGLAATYPLVATWASDNPFNNTVPRWSSELGCWEPWWRRSAIPALRMSKR